MNNGLSADGRVKYNYKIDPLYILLGLLAWNRRLKTWRRSWLIVWKKIQISQKSFQRLRELKWSFSFIINISIFWCHLCLMGSFLFPDSFGSTPQIGGCKGMSSPPFTPSFIYRMGETMNCARGALCFCFLLEIDWVGPCFYCRSFVFLGNKNEQWDT